MTGLVIILASFGALVAWWWIATTEPFGAAASDHTKTDIDPARLEAHVRKISEELGPRDFSNLPGLERVSKYILDQLDAAGARNARYQPYKVGATTYNNIVAEVGPDTKQRIVVGAHYDSAGPLPGADDNASGVAGVIELARSLVANPPSMKVELVAYCLEEPPYFRTPNMGSAVHARGLKGDDADVKAMFSLEMLGFFSDAPKSQKYPARILELFYPTVGNFITVVSTYGQHGLGGRVKRAMAASTDLPVRSLTATRMLVGIDFSDHQNYWNVGYPALMITDTSFYRNPHYHTDGDTPDTLDYVRMAKSVKGVLNAVLDLSSDGPK